MRPCPGCGRPQGETGRVQEWCAWCLHSEPTPSKDRPIPRHGKAKYAWADVLGDAYDAILTAITNEDGLDGGEGEAVLERLAALWEDDGPDSILVWSDARVAVVRRELDKLRGRIKTKYVTEAVREFAEWLEQNSDPEWWANRPRRSLADAYLASLAAKEEEG